MKLFTLKRFFVVSLLMCLGISQGWAGGTKTFYAKITATSNVNGTANGKVYASTTRNADGTYVETSTVSNSSEVNENNKDADVSFFLYAKPNSDDYGFVGWSKSQDGSSILSANGSGYEHKIKSNVENENSAPNETVYAIFKKNNIFSATVNIVTACNGVDVNLGTASVDGEETQVAKNLNETTHRFTFTVTADKVTTDYEFQGWSENINATSNYSSTNTTWNNYRITCNPNEPVTKTLYAIYKHKVHHSATMNAYSIGDGSEDEGGTVTVNGKPDTDTQTGYQVNSENFSFTLKATPAVGYYFFGWAESADGNIVSTNEEYTPAALTCTTEDEVTKDYYAVFGTKIENSMKPVRTDTYHLSNSTPTGTKFIIMDASSGKAMASSASAPRNSVSVNVETEDGDTYYAGDVDETNMPTTFWFEDNHIYFYNENNVKIYLCAEGLFDGNLTTTTSSSTINSSYGRFTCTPTADGVQITIKPISSTFYLQLTNNTFNIVKDKQATLRLLKYEEGEDVKTPITIGTAEGYGTYYNADNAYMMPEGLTGSVIIEAPVEGILHPKTLYQAGNIVPKGTALLIQGAKGSHDATVYKETRNTTETKATDYGYLRDNLLEGTREQRDGDWWTASEKDYDVYYYKLSYSNVSSKLGFYWGNETGDPFKLTKSYTAYLTVNQESEAKGFSLADFDDEETAIENVEVKTGNDAIYTVSGVRMNDTENLPVGIYIRNGKKFIVR